MLVIVQNPSASQQYRADGFLSMIKDKIIKLKHPCFIIQINAVNKDMDVFLCDKSSYLIVKITF